MNPFLVGYAVGSSSNRPTPGWAKAFWFAVAVAILMALTWLFS